VTQLRLSVAIATCGRPEALRTCLAAIAVQSRAPDQIIVVDQQPSSESRQVVAQSGLAVDYLEQAKLGLSASRNLALSAATGDILAVTDEDCFADPRWIEGLNAGFSLPVAPTAVTGPVLPPPGDPPSDMCALSLRTSRDTRLFSARVSPWLVGSGANFAARLSTLRDLGGWDERLGVGTRGMAGEDIDIVDRLLAAGGSILYSGDVVMHHAWQTKERRRATRWSYGYGIGAMSGLRLGERDDYGWRMLGSYSKMHVRELAREAMRGEWTAVGERLTSLAALGPSLIYGLRGAKTDANSQRSAGKLPIS
jgi:GT2 family glycosyltransferase